MKFIYQSPTPEIIASKSFYQKLNFQIQENVLGFLAYDKNIIFQINKERTSRAGIICYVDNLEEWENRLESKYPFIKKEGELICMAPCGIAIVFRSGTLEELKNKNATQCLLGNASGLTLETLDMRANIDFFGLLGFDTSKAKDSVGWIALSHPSGFGLSLLKLGMCPHLFFNPSISFFNGKEGNPKVIENLRKINIPFTEEITDFNSDGIVDNVIVRDPGGFGFFIFND